MNGRKDRKLVVANMANQVSHLEVHASLSRPNDAALGTQGALSGTQEALLATLETLPCTRWAILGAVLGNCGAVSGIQ